VKKSRVARAVGLLALLAFPGTAWAAGDGGMIHQMMSLVLQLAAIVIAARIGGELFERFLKQPAVLGELAAGMLIGPYALGSLLHIPDVGLLFPLADSGLPVSAELYGVATVASIVLLFMVGLETDFYQFMRYAGQGFAVGVGGVLGSFLTGAWLYTAFTGEAFMSPASLFMGTVSTATSVGITARVLSERRKLDSPEGTTILAGAVIDDVLGILILAVVGGVAAVQSAGGNGQIDWGKIGVIAAKAIGFWIVATALGIMASRRIAKFISWFDSKGAMVSLGFGLALLLAGVAEVFGLAMIIGAYIMGLSLSKEQISHQLERSLMPVYSCLTPIFFAVMGMLVDFAAMGKAVVFGVIYSLVAIVAKVVGSGLPCLFLGFNKMGAARIGMGMLPRGEVALIVAGVGVSQGFIGQDMFGVVIMMTLVTTVAAPPVLVRLFKSPLSGLRQPVEEKAMDKLIKIEGLTWANHENLIQSVKRVFLDRGFSLNVVNAEKGIYQLSGFIQDEKVNVTLEDFADRLEFKTHARHHLDVQGMINAGLEAARSRLSDLEVVEETVGPHNSEER